MHEETLSSTSICTCYHHTTKDMPIIAKSPHTPFVNKNQLPSLSFFLRGVSIPPVNMSPCVVIHGALDSKPNPCKVTVKGGYIANRNSVNGIGSISPSMLSRPCSCMIASIGWRELHTFRQATYNSHVK